MDKGNIVECLKVLARDPKLTRGKIYRIIGKRDSFLRKLANELSIEFARGSRRKARKSPRLKAKAERLANDPQLSLRRIGKLVGVSVMTLKNWGVRPAGSGMNPKCFTWVKEDTKKRLEELLGIPNITQVEITEALGASSGDSLLRFCRREQLDISKLPLRPPRVSPPPRACSLCQKNPAGPKTGICRDCYRRAWSRGQISVWVKRPPARQLKVSKASR